MDRAGSKKVEKTRTKSSGDTGDKELSDSPVVGAASGLSRRQLGKVFAMGLGLALAGDAVPQRESVAIQPTPPSSPAVTVRDADPPP